MEEVKLNAEGSKSAVNELVSCNLKEAIKQAWDSWCYDMPNHTKKG